MKNEFHPQLLEDAAAWLFWTLVSRDGFELTLKNVLQTRGQSLLNHPEREIIFRRYPLGEMPASTFSAFCSAVAEHAHARAVREENLTGMIYSEDRFSGRTSSAAGISAAHLDFPVTVEGESFPGTVLSACVLLCPRSCLPIHRHQRVSCGLRTPAPWVSVCRSGCHPRRSVRLNPACGF